MVRSLYTPGLCHTNEVFTRVSQAGCLMEPVPSPSKTLGLCFSLVMPHLVRELGGENGGVPQPHPSLSPQPACGMAITSQGFLLWFTSGGIRKIRRHIEQVQSLGGNEKHGVSPRKRNPLWLVPSWPPAAVRSLPGPVAKPCPWPRWPHLPGSARPSLRVKPHPSDRLCSEDRM